jgi:hypothetical protein
MNTEAFSAVFRSRSRRIEVEGPTAMFEFNLEVDGTLAPGDMFAQSGHDLRDVNGIQKGLALRTAREWLAEAGRNNARFRFKKV